MAKRKRLEMPVLEPNSPSLETKSAFSPKVRMPIADVAGDAAGRAALEEVAQEMTAAEAEGRVIKKLALSDIDTQHLSRDRMVLDAEDMEALKASLAARGQQTPVEVLTLDGGRYGLISGLRRIEALRALGETDVLALVRRPDGSQATYQAMVEENEIRAGLSFYERANIARAAVEQGVYGDIRSAVAGLFAHAAPAKRSKISKFVTICEGLGDALRFPTAIPEHLGLALAQALERDGRLAGRIGTALDKAAPDDAAGERKVLEAALKKPSGATRRDEELAPGLSWRGSKGRVVLSGPALTPEFAEALRNFAILHAKNTN